MQSWITFAILAALITVSLAGAAKDPKHELTKEQKDARKQKLHENQAHFIQRAKEIKEDGSMGEEEKEEELHKLREHAMMFMGAHAILPHALMQPSPIEAIEEKRQALVHAVEAIAHTDLGFEEKKVQLEQLRDTFKQDVDAIHHGLSKEDVAKVRSTMKKQARANAYTKMIRDNIRGEGAANARGHAYDDALKRGMEKVREGLMEKEMMESGAYRRGMAEKQMAGAAKGKAKRAAKLSISRPDM